MESKVTILFCIDTLTGGGAERLLIQILKRFNYDVFLVDLYVMNNYGVYFDDIPPQVNWFTRENENRQLSKRYDIEIAFLEGTPTKYIAQRKCTVCYVDRLYHTEINYDGKIFKCTARDYSDKYVKGTLQNDGHIEWNKDMIAKQYGKATFENEMCLACKHLPICNGTCSQKMIEIHNNNYESICPLKSSKVKPEYFIIDLYEKQMRSFNEKSETTERK